MNDCGSIETIKEKLLIFPLYKLWNLSYTRTISCAKEEDIGKENTIYCV